MAKSIYNDIVDLKKIKYLRQVEGYNDKQLIEYLGIHKDTFYKWIKRHTDFAEALKIDRKQQATELVETLFKKAKGFWIEEVTTEITERGSEKVKHIKKVKKWVQSDTALIFALSNLDPLNWKRQDKNVVAKNNNTIEPHTVSDNEIMGMFDD